MLTIPYSASLATAANLTQAQAAVAYVQSKMDIGASNKFGPSDWVGKLPKALCVSEVRDKVEIDLKKLSKITAKAQIEASSDWSKHYGCGNCGEQSAIAFVFLRQRQVKPLEWLMYSGMVNHAFVAIGRDVTTKVESIINWNDDTIICDPWRGVALPAASASYLLGKRLDLLYREA